MQVYPTSPLGARRSGSLPWRWSRTCIQSSASPARILLEEHTEQVGALGAFSIAELRPRHREICVSPAEGENLRSLLLAGRI
jgi:hypothetical protein